MCGIAVEVAGPAHQPVGVTAAPVGLPGQPGTGGLGAVGGPHLAAVPRARSAGTTAASNRVDSPPEGDHGVVHGGVVEGVEVDVGEVVDRRCQRVEQSPSHAATLSNKCSRSNPYAGKLFAGLPAEWFQERRQWP